MPCTQTGSLEGDSLLSATQTNQELVKENTKLTQLLCELCGSVDRYYEENIGLFCANISMSSELKRWWNKHKQIDAKGKN